LEINFKRGIEMKNKLDEYYEAKQRVRVLFGDKLLGFGYLAEVILKGKSVNFQGKEVEYEARITLDDLNNNEEFPGLDFNDEELEVLRKFLELS